MYYKVDNELKEIENLDNVSDKDDVVILLTLEQWHEACRDKGIPTYYAEDVYKRQAFYFYTRVF